MSGIAAAFGADTTRELRRIGHALDARGPSGREEALFDAGGLCATVAAPGEQHALATDRSGRWTVVTDGELLNGRALLSELEAWGEAPEVPSTPAIVAEILNARGFVGGLERFAGDVAIVAWDGVERRLWAARDRAGLRPLHWKEAGGTLTVASEAGVLPSTRAADVDAVAEALAFDGALPPRSPVAGVSALAPGALLSWTPGGGIVHHTHWSDVPNPSGADGARYRWARSACFAVELAVQQRAQVEAPVAVALSGGVYSEAVLAGVAARRREPILALTLALEGVDLARAEAIARKHRAIHVVVPLTTAEVPALLTELAAGNDPVLAPEAIAWRALARAAWAHDRAVLLTGLGGSSLFGGAPLPVLDRAASLPGIARLGRLARGGAAHRRLLGAARGTTASEAVWAAVDRLVDPKADATGTLLALQRQLDAAGIHATVDRVVALDGLRVSSPLADPALTRLIASFPVGHLVQVRRPRGLFLDALAERLLPDAPEHAPMSLPLDAWCNAVTPTPEPLPPSLRALWTSGSARERWGLRALAAWLAG